MSPELISFAKDEAIESASFQKGVKYYCDKNFPLTKIPNKYVLPISDRPNISAERDHADHLDSKANFDLPVIDYAELQGPNRSHVIQSLAKACEEYGVFQLINHGISREVIHRMMDASRRFFEAPHEERGKYMSSDMYSPVRYGTSFNQSKDKVFSWRDFLKLTCPPPAATLPNIAPISCWPSSPVDFREAVVNYSNEAKYLYMMIMEAIFESLGLAEDEDIMGRRDDDEVKYDYYYSKKNSNNKNKSSSKLKEIEEGSQMMVLNCYPKCPEPDLTLGMPPHSDYGLLTLVLQDEVKGLQIQHQGRWVTVEPNNNNNNIADPNSSFVVNVGDHLEIFSNGKYKSVLHRVLVNSQSTRISIASLHSGPFDCTIQPSPKLINEANPKLYKDTTFATFLEYASSCEPKSKSFLESRKLL